MDASLRNALDELARQVERAFARGEVLNELHWTTKIYVKGREPGLLLVSTGRGPKLSPRPGSRDKARPH
jgi:hypothetical protein